MIAISGWKNLIFHTITIFLLFEYIMFRSITLCTTSKRNNDNSEKNYHDDEEKQNADTTATTRIHTNEATIGGKTR